MIITVDKAEKSAHSLEVAIDDLEAKTRQDTDEVIKAGGQWEDIGFHRPLGNYFYGLFMSIFNMILGLALIDVFTSLLYPFPEINGYNNLSGGIYAIIFTVFDTGTGFGIERFIAEWPGQLGIFREVLNGLQLYNKSQILGFICGTFFQNITNIAFILLGRWIGLNDPAIGELVGMTVGAAIGGYVDDFFAFAVSARFFDKAMRAFGYTWRDCFRIEFDRQIVKQCLWFGFQVSVVPMVSTATSTWVLFMMIESIPSLATYKALLSWVGGIIGFIDAGNFSLVPSIAESYMNGKTELTRFYIANSLRWNGFLMVMFASVLLAAMGMVIQVILGLPGLQYYVTSFIFFVPALIHKMELPFIAYPDSILVGILKINFYTFSRIFEEVVYVTENLLWMYVFRIQDTFGVWGIVYILAMDRFLCRNIKMVMMWLYIHKRCFPVKFYFWQMFICPAIASTPIFAFGLLWKPLVFDKMIPLFAGLGAYAVIPPAAITVLIALVVVPLFLFLPLTGLLGGWDDFGLMTLRKAVNLSGPSRPFSRLLYKAVLWGAKRSKIHNRFKIPWEKPMQEIKDLMLMKRDHAAQLYERRVIGFKGAIT